MSETIVGRAMEERIGHIEGTLEQMDRRLGSLEAQIQNLRGEIREVRSRIWWVVGIVVGTWVTTIGMLVAILLKA